MTTTTTLTPWSTREDIAAAMREEQAQREAAIVDPQTKLMDQLYERMTAMFQAALPSGFDTTFLEQWREEAQAAAAPPATDFAALNNDRLAALQSQVHNLVQAMAGFAPPAAVETTALSNDGRNNSLLQTLAASAQ